MLPDPVLPMPEDDIARILRDYGRRLSHLETLEGGGAWALIEDVEIAAPVANFDFQNIPATFNVLKLLCSLRSDQAAANSQIHIRFNNDAGANYDALLTFIRQASALTTEEDIATGQARMVYISAATAPANAFGAVEITLLDYLDTSKLQAGFADGHWIGAQSTTSIFRSLGGFTWRNTAAVNRVTVIPNGGTNFVAGSRISLYGIRAD